jgi:hypothetical protein
MCHKQPDFCMLASYFARASEIRIDRYSVFEPTGGREAPPHDRLRGHRFA